MYLHKNPRLTSESKRLLPRDVRFSIDDDVVLIYYKLLFIMWV